MKVSIEIPGAMRRFTGDAQVVHVDADTVEEALLRFSESFPRTRPLLYADDGRRRRYVNVFLNERDIRILDEGHSSIAEGDRLLLVAATAGG